MWSKKSWFVLEERKRNQSDLKKILHMQMQKYPTRAAELHLYNNLNQRGFLVRDSHDETAEDLPLAVSKL